MEQEKKKRGGQEDVEGFRPEWCISTIYHAWDTPFWLGTLKLCGLGPEWCISTIYHAWDTPFWLGTLDVRKVEHKWQRVGAMNLSHQIGVCGLKARKDR